MARSRRRSSSKTAVAAASRRGKLSRRKGKVYEREVAAQYRELYGEQVKRGWQAREGHDAPDVENVPSLWVECKHHGKVPMRAAFEQALEAREKAGSALAPVAHCKDDGKEALVVLQESEWFQLLAKLKRLEEGAHEQDLLKRGALPRGLEEREKLAAGAATAYTGGSFFVPAQPPKLKNGHAA